VRVVVAEDHPVFRRGLVELLAEAGVDVVAEAGSPAELLAVVAKLHPDAVVVDIRMPPTFTTEGLDAARRLKDGQPDLGVLVLSAYVVPEYAERLLSAHPGGVGYLIKERVASVSVLRDALDRVVRGEAVIDASLVEQLLHRPRSDGLVSRLTSGELRVLGLMAEGHTNRGIADVLSVTVGAVEAHIRGIFRKLDLTDDGHRRVLAVLTFLREQPSPLTGPASG
jgi:DNA-binding NarL/FixJ family response regulator